MKKYVTGSNACDVNSDITAFNLKLGLFGMAPRCDKLKLAFREINPAYIFDKFPTSFLPVDIHAELGEKKARGIRATGLLITT